MPRRSLARVTAATLALVVLVSAVALGAGSRAGATRAAKRHTIAHIKHFGITLRAADLDLRCSPVAHSRWRCFVYANGGQCTGTLSEKYSTSMRCQLPSVSPQRRPSDLPIGGHVFSPLAAIGSPRRVG